MSDEEFATLLGGIPREKSVQQVEFIEHKRDLERGQYIPHAEITHHCGESAH